MSKPVSQMGHDFNNDFDKLIRAADSGKLSCRLSHFYTRPAYYGTKQQTGELKHDERENGLEF